MCVLVNCDSLRFSFPSFLYNHPLCSYTKPHPPSYVLFNFLSGDLCIYKNIPFRLFLKIVLVDTIKVWGYSRPTFISTYQLFLSQTKKLAIVWNKSFIHIVSSETNNSRKIILYCNISNVGYPIIHCFLLVSLIANYDRQALYLVFLVLNNVYSDGSSI